jgi:hypothetical protein
VVAQYRSVGQDLDGTLQEGLIWHLVYRPTFRLEVGCRQSDRQKPPLNAIDAEQLAGVETILYVAAGCHLARPAVTPPAFLPSRCTWRFPFRCPGPSGERPLTRDRDGKGGDFALGVPPSCRWFWLASYENAPT